MSNKEDCEKLNEIDNLIYKKISDDDNLVECENVLKLSEKEKIFYCAFRYYLEQMNDGLMAIFTGYASPLILEIRGALKEIGAVENLKILNSAIEKINVENKNEEDFLEDIKNEELEHLYDEETEDEYEDFLNALDRQIYDCNEDVQKLIFEYWMK